MFSGPGRPPRTPPMPMERQPELSRAGCHDSPPCAASPGQLHRLQFDVPRGRRKLTRYLGTDETRWDQRFRGYLHDDPTEKGTIWLRLDPTSLIVKDLSYTV
jgi:hypothetical protein